LARPNTCSNSRRPSSRRPSGRSCLEQPEGAGQERPLRAWEPVRGTGVDRQHSTPARRPRRSHQAAHRMDRTPSAVTAEPRCRVTRTVRPDVAAQFGAEPPLTYFGGDLVTGALPGGHLLPRHSQRPAASRRSVQCDPRPDLGVHVLTRILAHLPDASIAPAPGVESNTPSRNGHPMHPWWPRYDAAEFEVREQWGRGEMGYAQLTSVDVDAIPADSIIRALVVIPTISRRKHSKSNSARGGK
jgi:hypothetical protein